MNVNELYEQTIKSLPAAERLRLAVLILNDIPPQSVVDDSESWTEVDLQEFTQASWQHLDQHLEDEAYGCPRRCGDSRLYRRDGPQAPSGRCRLQRPLPPASS